MSLLLLVLGLVLLGLPGAVGAIGARLAPAEWCRAVVVCLRVGRIAVHAALALAAVPVVLQALGTEGAAHACHRALAAALPLPPGAGWVTAVALGALTAHGVVVRRRRAVALRRLRAEPWLGRHRVEDGVDIVTLPCSARLAYAVPGRPDQVVVSEGMLAGLDHEEALAVVRHERAHLRHRHHEALALAGDVEARLGSWFRPARASASVLRLAVERWADEDAGAVSARARPAVRTALLETVALATGPAPAFTDVGTLAARLRALASTPPAPGTRVRVAAIGPIVAATAVAVAGLAAVALVAPDGPHALVLHDHAGHEHYVHDHDGH